MGTQMRSDRDMVWAQYGMIAPTGKPEPCYCGGLSHTCGNKVHTPPIVTGVKDCERLAQFPVGSAPLAQITDAAAELLTEAYLMTPRFGVELGGIFDSETARELVEERMGDVQTDCETHGFACPPGDDCSADMVQVFKINDAGEAWLEDAGKI